jgi:hypothetical protein
VRRGNAQQNSALALAAWFLHDNIVHGMAMARNLSRLIKYKQEIGDSQGRTENETHSCDINLYGDQHQSPPTHTTVLWSCPPAGTVKLKHRRGLRCRYGANGRRSLLKSGTPPAEPSLSLARTEKEEEQWGTQGIFRRRMPRRRMPVS